MSQEYIEARARVTDPVTSHLAAEAANKKLPKIDDRIRSALQAAGSAGMTLDELIEATGAQKVSVSPRLRPLTRMGFVVETEETRKGSAGLAQIVWRTNEPIV